MVDGVELRTILNTIAKTSCLHIAKNPLIASPDQGRAQGSQPLGADTVCLLFRVPKKNMPWPSPSRPGEKKHAMAQPGRPGEKNMPWPSPAGPAKKYMPWPNPAGPAKITCHGPHCTLPWHVFHFGEMKCCILFRPEPEALNGATPMAPGAIGANGARPIFAIGN